MPRPRSHHGRPGTRVIPGRWDGHHAPIASNTLTGRCVITIDGGPGTFDPDLGYTVPAPRPVLYDGGYRLQDLGQAARTSLLGSQNITTGAYLLVIGRPARVIHPKARIDFHGQDTDGNPLPMDPDLDDRPFWVASIVRGSHRWERDLTIVDDLTMIGGDAP